MSQTGDGDWSDSAQQAPRSGLNSREQFLSDERSLFGEQFARLMNALIEGRQRIVDRTSREICRRGSTLRTR